MQKYIDIVASTFLLVATTKQSHFVNAGNFGGSGYLAMALGPLHKTPTLDNKLYYDNLIIELHCVVNYDYYIKLFAGLSLIQLRDLLYLLVPCSSNWVKSENNNIVNTLPHVKMAIKYIEQEIFVMGDDESKTHMDLITENNLLQNKCNELQSKLDIIIGAINK